jgi:ubiquinone/menaquinone biosynthesis C-methylase UbiE
MKNKSVKVAIDTYQKSSYEKIKSYERFGFLFNNIKSQLKKTETLLDIGCAKGELIYLLKEEYPEIKYTGLEYSINLINIAKNEQFLKDVEFIEGDAADFELNRKFDTVIMSGVLSIFDDISKPLLCMLKHIKSGGKGYIFGGFNVDNIDVILKYRNNYQDSKEWESGLNIFSIDSVKKIIHDEIVDFNYKKFNISQELKKESNPIKSYTLNLENGEKLIVTGAGVIRDFYLIEFIKK